MIVNTENWGPPIEQDEFCKLCNRGYRGRNTVKGSYSNGQGFGLHILKQICESNNIKLDISTREQKNIQGRKYSKFSVRLTYENIFM